MNKNNNKGFTLIELMVVMAIIAVLSVLIVAAIQSARQASIRTQNIGNAHTIETALEAYASKKNGQYPTTIDGQNFADATDNATQDILRSGGYLSAAITGSCVNAGGTISVPSTTTFTLTVYDSDCTTVHSKITH